MTPLPSDFGVECGAPVMPTSVRKPLLSDLEDSLNEAKDRVVTIYDLVESLEATLFGSGGVKGESLKAPEPARSLETLVNKSGQHAANLASLAIRLENLISRL